MKWFHELGQKDCLELKEAYILILNLKSNYKPPGFKENLIKSFFSMKWENICYILEIDQAVSDFHSRGNARASIFLRGILP